MISSFVNIMMADGADLQRVREIDMVVLDSGADRIPAFGLDLPTGAGLVIGVGSHLREQSVAQSQRGIAKGGKLAAVHNSA